MGSMLYALDVPPAGGDTLFANMFLAYEQLSAGMQALLSRIAGREQLGQSGRLAHPRGPHRVEPGQGARQAFEATHPVVRTHPESGRKGLYVNFAHTARFEGMTEDESAPLLEFLFRHQVQPEFTCRFRWSAGVARVLGQPLDATQSDQRLSRPSAADAAHHDRRDDRSAESSALQRTRRAFAAQADARTLPRGGRGKGQGVPAVRARGGRCRHARPSARAGSRAVASAGAAPRHDSSTTRRATPATPRSPTARCSIRACRTMRIPRGTSAWWSFPRRSRWPRRSPPTARSSSPRSSRATKPRCASAATTRRTRARAAFARRRPTACSAPRRPRPAAAARRGRDDARAVARGQHGGRPARVRRVRQRGLRVPGRRRGAQRHPRGTPRRSGRHLRRLGPRRQGGLLPRVRRARPRLRGARGRRPRRRVRDACGHLQAVSRSASSIAASCAATVALRERAGAAALASIAVRMHPFEADFFGVRYTGPFATFPQAFMSAPFCAALAWARGDATLAGLTDFATPRCWRSCRASTIVSDAGRPRYAPRIDARLADGTTLEWEERDNAERLSSDAGTRRPAWPDSSRPKPAFLPRSRRDSRPPSRRRTCARPSPRCAKPAGPRAPSARRDRRRRARESRTR